MAIRHPFQALALLLLLMACTASLLAILPLQGAIGSDVTYQLAYSFHSITQKFKPDIVAGVYLNDLWQITDKWRANVGVRLDTLTGFTHSNEVDPTVNLTYEPFSTTTIHGGFARYMQVPSFQGVAPDASAVFAGTSGAAGPPGTVNPKTEDDYEWDLGVVQHVTPSLTISEDNFFEITKHY